MNRIDNIHGNIRLKFAGRNFNVRAFIEETESLLMGRLELVVRLNCTPVEGPPRRRRRQGVLPDFLPETPEEELELLLADVDGYDAFVGDTVKVERKKSPRKKSRRIKRVVPKKPKSRILLDE